MISSTFDNAKKAGSLGLIVSDVYSTIKDAPTFERIIIPKVMDYKVKDGDREVSLYDFAKQRGLEGYLRDQITYESNNWRGKMAKAWRTMRHVKAGLEGIVETHELATDGLKFSPTKIKGLQWQGIFYLASNKVYNDVGEFFGRAIGAYKPNLQGVYDVYSDSAKGTARALARSTPFVGGLDHVLNLWDTDNRDNRIARAFGEILYDKVRKKAGEGSRVHLGVIGETNGIKTRNYSTNGYVGSGLDSVPAQKSGYNTTRLSA